MKKFIVAALPLFLVGCGGGEKAPEIDVSEMRVQCEELSGFSGKSQIVPETGLVFVWRADDAMVAECQDGELVGIMESGNHPGDKP